MQQKMKRLSVMRYQPWTSDQRIRLTHSQALEGLKNQIQLLASQERKLVELARRKVKDGRRQQTP